MGGARSGSSSRSSGSRPRGPWRRRLAVAGLVLLTLWLYQAYQTVNYTRHIPAPPAAEFALVLGAKSAGPQPLPIFQERIEYGIELYRQGKVQRLLFTGAPGDPPQAVVARDYAVARGVPESAIVLETQSHRTIENLRFAQRLLPDPRGTPVLIVSDPLHLRRAMKMAEDLGIKAYPAPTTRVRGTWGKFKMSLREGAAYWRYFLERLW